MSARLKLGVIACPSLRPVLDLLAPQAGPEISLRYLDMALHDRSAAALLEALQNTVDRTDDCDAIAIGYGLCNRGIVGLEARVVPLVLPRAHDCVGLLLGSTKRYLDQLDAEPGTYFQHAGFLMTRPDEAGELTFGPASNASFERLAAQYGDDAAQYLHQQLTAFTKHYKRLAFIATPVPDAPNFAAQAQAIAASNGLAYHPLDGDVGWLARLLQGDWQTEDFLIVQPGQSVGLSGGMIEAT